MDFFYCYIYRLIITALIQVLNYCLSALLASNYLPKARARYHLFFIKHQNANMCKNRHVLTQF